MGVLSPFTNTSTQLYELEVFHNLEEGIKECGFFIQPKKASDYRGSFFPQKDYEELIFLGENYEKGLFITQSYTATGEIYRQNGRRLIDTTRVEDRDIFAGQMLILTTGPLAGEQVRIISYDFENSIFYLEDDFPVNVDGEKYKIEIQEEIPFSSKQGSSQEFPIKALYKGGKLAHLESMKVGIQVRLPVHLKDSGVRDFEICFTYLPGN